MRKFIFILLLLMTACVKSPALKEVCLSSNNSPSKCISNNPSANASQNGCLIDTQLYSNNKDATTLADLLKAMNRDLHDYAQLKQRKDIMVASEKAEKNKEHEQKSLHYAYYKEIKRCSENELSAENFPEAHKILAEILKRIVNEYYQQEEKLFSQRTKGKKICGAFLQVLQPIPGYQVNYNNCVYYEWGNNLIASQVTNDGIIARSYKDNPNTLLPYYVFIHKDIKDANIADGALMSNGHFEYTGLYKYDTIFGAGKTVYSFKRVNPAVFKDIYFYD